MPSKREASKTRQVTIRLPEGVMEQVETAAAERGVAKDWFLARLVIESIDRIAPPDTFALIVDEPGLGILRGVREALQAGQIAWGSPQEAQPDPGDETAANG